MPRPPVSAGGLALHVRLVPVLSVPGRQSAGPNQPDWVVQQDASLRAAQQRHHLRRARPAEGVPRVCAGASLCRVGNNTQVAPSCSPRRAGVRRRAAADPAQCMAAGKLTIFGVWRHMHDMGLTSGDQKYCPSALDRVLVQARPGGWPGGWARQRGCHRTPAQRLAWQGGPSPEPRAAPQCLFKIPDEKMGPDAPPNCGALPVRSQSACCPRGASVRPPALRPNGLDGLQGRRRRTTTRTKTSPTRTSWRWSCGRRRATKGWG